MADVLNLLGQATRKHVCLKAAAGIGGLHSSLRNSCQFQQENLRLRWQRIKTGTNNRRFKTIVSAMEDEGLHLTPSSPSETIKHFYTCNNEKNLKQLEGCISENCYFEECSFANPFYGKKEVMYFFDQLTRSMGKNVKFSIENVCEGDDFTAGVNWHLKWKETEVPFTRGCSFYECSEEGERLVIRKARVVVESVIKPGVIVLILLKNVTSLFDEYPKAAEWILRSPRVVLQIAVKIYTILLAPFLDPLLASYLKLWEFTALLFAFTVKFLVFVGKNIFK